MVNTLQRAPLTGAILPVVKQSGVKQLCADMVKAGIIPEIQTTGYQNGVSGFIYYSEILEIHHKHSFAIDCLVSAYADSLGESDFTVLANVAEHLGMESSDKTDVVKTILAVDYLAVLFSEHGTARANLTDSQGYEIQVDNIFWDCFTKMRQSENWDLLDSMLTRQTGGEFTITVNEDTDITVCDIQENDETGEEIKTEYTVDFYIELADATICVL